MRFPCVLGDFAMCVGEMPSSGDAGCTKKWYHEPWETPPADFFREAVEGDKRTLSMMFINARRRRCDRRLQRWAERTNAFIWVQRLAPEAWLVYFRNEHLYLSHKARLDLYLATQVNSGQEQ